MHHVIKIRINISQKRYSFIFVPSPRITLTRHEVTQEKYSPKFTRKYRKIPKHHKHVHATNPYKINIIIIYRERMREEGDK